MIKIPDEDFNMKTSVKNIIIYLREYDKKQKEKVEVR